MEYSKKAEDALVITTGFLVVANLCRRQSISKVLKNSDKIQLILSLIYRAQNQDPKIQKLLIYGRYEDIGRQVYLISNYFGIYDNQTN